MEKVSRNILYITISIVILSLIPYVIVFNGGISIDPSDWSVFGSYFGGLVTPFVTVCTLYWLIFSFKEQLNDMHEVNRTNIEYLEREKKFQLLNFYLSEAEKRIIQFREVYDYKKANGIEYYDLTKFELEEKGYTIHSKKRDNYDIEVIVTKNGVTSTLVYHEKRIWTIIHEFIGRVGKEKARLFFKQGGFAIGEIHMSSYASQLAYLYRLLLQASQILEELNMDNFVIRNMLTDHINQIKLLRDIDWIDNQLYYCIMSMLDKPDISINRRDRMITFLGLKDELKDQLNVTIELDNCLVYRYIDLELLNDIYIVEVGSIFYKRSFNERGITEWNEVYSADLIDVKKTQINFS